MITFYNLDPRFWHRKPLNVSLLTGRRLRFDWALIGQKLTPESGLLHQRENMIDIASLSIVMLVVYTVRKKINK